MGDACDVYQGRRWFCCSRAIMIWHEVSVGLWLTCVKHLGVMTDLHMARRVVAGWTRNVLVYTFHSVASI